jgi:hypothetical protein
LIAIYIFFRHIIIFIHIHGNNRGSIDLHNVRGLFVSTCNLLLHIIYVQRNCRMVLHRMKIFSLSKVDSHKKKKNTQQFYLNQNNWGKCPVGNFENKVRWWFQSIILIYTRHLLLKCMFQAWKVSTSLYWIMFIWPRCVGTTRMSPPWILRRLANVSPFFNFLSKRLRITNEFQSWSVNYDYTLSYQKSSQYLKS